MSSQTVNILASLAHDLRNTINVVRGGSQLLALDSVDSIAAETAQSAASLALMMDRLISSAKRETSLSNSLTTISIEEVVRSAAKRVKRDYGVSIDLPDFLDATTDVQTDPVQAEIVLTDLVGLRILDGRLPNIRIDGELGVHFDDTGGSVESELLISAAGKAALLDLLEFAAATASIDLIRSSPSTIPERIEFSSGSKSDSK